MFMGTPLSQSITASPPWHSASAPSLYMAPSPTSPLTTISDAQVLPFPAPTLAVPAAPVVINLHADVTVSRFDHFYDALPSSFRPTYYATVDGSLLSQSYVDEMTTSKSPVFIAGALCVFFLRNARKSLLFLRRTRVKDKTLFYLLALSQILGLVAGVVITVGLLDMSVGCHTITAVKKTLMKLSSDAMITGIIGVKAYRCLGNNRFVLLFLFFVTATVWTLEGLELANNSAYRSQYGVCLDTGHSPYLSAVILTEFIETAVLCACFFFAVARSYRTRAEARVTVSTADEGKLYERNDATDAAEGTPPRRGWWDYVPDAHLGSSNGGRPYMRAMTHAFMEWTRRMWSDDDFPAGFAYQRKPSLPGEFPLPQPPRRPTSGQSTSWKTLRRFTHISSFPGVFTLRRWSGHLFGRQLFQKMLRNELLYTTVITAVFMALTIALLVGVHSNASLSAESWIVLNWVAISMCTMHSFSRVARRHELESILQHPAAWDRMLRTDVDYSKVFYGSDPRQTTSSDDSSTSPSHPRIRTNRSHASFLPNYDPSHDAPCSSYNISPITPSSSRKPSAVSPLPSLPFQQSPSPYDTPPRSLTPDTLAPLPYPPSSPTASFSRFSFTVTKDSHAEVQRPPADLGASRPPFGSRRFSLDAWTDQRTNIDLTYPNTSNRPSRSSS